MKKLKNKQGKKISRLIPEIRNLIKKFAHHHTTMAALLRPALSSILSMEIPDSLNDILLIDNSIPLTLPRTFEEEFNDEAKKLRKKYKKINIYKMYWQIRMEDMYNFDCNNYPINPRDASYIDENGRRIIRK